MSNTGYSSIDKKHNDGKSFFKKNQIIPSMSIYNMLGMISSFYRDETIAKRLEDNLLIDELIASDLDLLKYAEPNDGDKLGDFVLPKIDYIIWKEEK